MLGREMKCISATPVRNAREFRVSSAVCCREHALPAFRGALLGYRSAAGI